MRIHPSRDYGDGASAQVVHKAVQSQVHGSKVGAHRYERRKVRECLRQAEAEQDLGLAAIDHARLQS